MCQGSRALPRPPATRESLPGFTGRAPAALRYHQSKGLISGGIRNTGGHKERQSSIFFRLRLRPYSGLPRQRHFPATPDPSRLCLKNNFNPDLLYEVVYTAKDPFCSRRRDGRQCAMSSHSSVTRRKMIPAPRIRSSEPFPHVIGMGNFAIRALCQKSFLNLGFNEDERTARSFGMA